MIFHIKGTNKQSQNSLENNDIIEIRAIEFVEYVIVIYISHRNVDRRERVEKQSN